jgi:hypothetical protein
VSVALINAQLVVHPADLACFRRRRAAERIRVAKAAEEAAKLQEALSRMTIKERVHLLELRTSQTRLRLALNRSRSASPSSKPAESQDSFDDAVVPPPPSTPKAAQVKRIAQQESKSPARTMPSPDSVSQADEVENVIAQLPNGPFRVFRYSLISYFRRDYEPSSAFGRNARNWNSSDLRITSRPK